MNRVTPLVKFEPERVVNIEPAPTNCHTVRVSGCVPELISGHAVCVSCGATNPVAATWMSRYWRARYKITPAELLNFFRALLETDDTVIEAAEEVRNALDWHSHGADFADALQLAACGAAVMHP